MKNIQKEFLQQLGLDKLQCLHCGIEIFESLHEEDLHVSIGHRYSFSCKNNHFNWILKSASLSKTQNYIEQSVLVGPIGSIDSLYFANNQTALQYFSNSEYIFEKLDGFIPYSKFIKLIHFR